MTETLRNALADPRLKDYPLKVTAPGGSHSLFRAEGDTRVAHNTRHAQTEADEHARRSRALGISAGAAAAAIAAVATAAAFAVGASRGHPPTPYA